VGWRCVVHSSNITVIFFFFFFEYEAKEGMPQQVSASVNRAEPTERLRELPTAVERCQKGRFSVHSQSR
jgi:hypothetical protein